MSDPDVLTVRLAAPGPVRLRWCRSLAYAVAATPGPSGAVFEVTNRDPVPRVTVRPRSLLETFRAALPHGGSDLVPGESWPALKPPPGWANRIRYVVSPGSTGPTAYLSEVGRDFPDLEPLVGPVGWLGVQTYWIRTSSGELWAARRFCLAVPDEEELAMRIERVALAVAADWTRRIDAAATTRAAARGGARDWRRGTLSTAPGTAGWVRSADRVAATAEFPFVPAGGPALAGEGHGVVFGASGAGKTTFLARLAAHEIASGQAVVVIDLHGDLVPSIVARLSGALRAKVVAVDVTSPPVPGIAALNVGETADDLAAAHFVAALKRLSPDGTELHWGFRLERILDAFTRLAQETGGSLLDLFDLLTDPVRRDAARLATRRADLARFLDELAPILRRQPDFLWSAATRLSKVVLGKGLAELLAPSDGGLPVEDLIDRQRPVLVRLPFAALGPESAAFAGSLVLARIYLGLAARRRVGFPPRTMRLFLDEAQGFSPRLVCELLTESRKFGLRVLLATQFPDRLAPEVRAAAAGALADFVTFRVPPAVAGTVGGWVGLSREEGERWLPALPVGYGVRLDPTTGTARSVPPGDTFAFEEGSAWSEVVDRTRDEFDVPPSGSEELRAGEDLTERLLLAVLAAEEGGRPLAPSEAVDAADALPGPSLGRERLGDRWPDLVRQEHVVVTDGRCRLTDAGQRRLGLGAPTGAVRESSEHRALLLAAFRLFARRGYRLEILRQGRFDTTLPDAVFHQLPRRSEGSPAELAGALDRIRHGWAWRAFGGRDVHIEVEVSGALRSERIRRGWRKASSRGAFVLFVVGDARRANRVRATLRGLGVGPDRAQVWTLSLPGRPRAEVLSTDRANP